MAILSFDTGKPDDSIDQPEQVPEQRQGRVLDFGTGKPLDVQPQVSVQPNQMLQEPQAIPASATTPFPAAREETTAVRDLPEIGQGGLLFGEDKLKVAAIAPVLLTTTNPQEMADILKQSFPEAIGIQYDEGGNIIAANNKTGSKVVINKPGISQLDVLQTLGITAAFLPAGRAAAAGAGLAAKVGLGAVASGLTQTAIEAIQEQVGGTLDRDEIALAASLGGVAETVVPAIQSLRASRQASRLGVETADVAKAVETVKPAREAQEAIEQSTGVKVPLFQGQQTMQPSTLLKQRLLPQLDAGSRKAAAELEGQNKAVFEATSELVNTIAGPEVLETGAKRFRTAAQTALEAGKQRRSQAVALLYKDALDQGAEVDLKPVKDLVEESLKDAPSGGKIAPTFAKIKGFLSGTVNDKGETVAPTLRHLQKAKFEIDDMLEAFGENALGTTTKREVLQIQKELVNQMEQASPGYKAANEEFIRLSPAVTELQDSILGSVSKLDDVSLKNISSRIFDVRQTDPSVVVKAKKIIDQADPGAWDDLMRVEMQRRIGGIETLAEDLPGELVGNVPGQLRRALFGNPGQRKVLLAGMNPEQRKNFVYLDDVLRRASAGRQAGSPTAAFGEVLDKIRGVGGVIRDMIFRPLSSLQATGERGLFDRNVSKLTDVLFNPKWEPKLKELREIPPQSEKAKAIFSELMNAAKAAPQVTDSPIEKETK